MKYECCIRVYVTLHYFLYLLNLIKHAISNNQFCIQIVLKLHNLNEQVNIIIIVSYNQKKKIDSVLIN